ncbi:hypothetical protein C8F04DRAFT_261861 [Mycena alexandri]|uniref:DUF6534 domain-containing protein n=1 Tax=Mycena alexandri TaxID=1745969 RepID=A0AAD6S7E5_9AGAR|nr:hypothetical protein C8F04DRAFT_261861 [Mycena alexandri]
MSAQPVLDPRIAVGPTFVANILNWLLMGALLVQVFSYYQRFRNDRIGIRALVYGIFCLDLAQTIMLTFHGWWALVASWGRPDLLSHYPWTASMVPFMCGLVSAIVQIFYAQRIWILSPNRLTRVLAVVIVLTALAQGIGAMAGGMVAATARSFSRRTILEMKDQFTLWLAGSLAADALITGCMAYILARAKSRTSWKKSETLLSSLIIRTLETGALTMVGAAVELALFVLFPDKTFHYVPGYTLGKLYSNSLMLSLNIRRPHDATESASSRPTFSFDHRQAHSGTAVYVEQHTMRHLDVESSDNTLHGDTWIASKE